MTPVKTQVAKKRKGKVRCFSLEQFHTVDQQYHIRKLRGYLIQNRNREFKVEFGYSIEPGKRLQQDLVFNLFSLSVTHKGELVGQLEAISPRGEELLAMPEATFTVHHEIKLGKTQRDPKGKTFRPIEDIYFFANHKV